MLFKKSSKLSMHQKNSTQKHKNDYIVLYHMFIVKQSERFFFSFQAHCHIKVVGRNCTGLLS